MSVSVAAALYLVSGVLFILALRGLSSPETSRQGNTYGMLGMALAVGVTLAVIPLDPVTIGFIAGGVAVGGIIGAVTARQVQMTQMPQLVAAFHSLVGLAAVAVAAAAFYAPDAFHIAPELAAGRIKAASLIELSLGTAIGALTFTGSVIAFAKLNGNMSGAPIILPARHLVNILLAAALVALIVFMVQDLGQSLWVFWAVLAVSLLLGVLLIIPIG
ncbi:MAG: NAD(P)(+) transhydrogenase (Re/Si-specific) subunit beta, partial [Hyphomonadaceae bacterium]|nr:NAD(P)(+) transhydrogenase (Re/Si-specific) subunit beta [Hyphomonadaceae bacterium]